MTTSTAVTQPKTDVDFIGIWITRCLEGLWLLALGLVPLAYLSPDYILSEAAIGYVEVPKITLLRVLTGLMVLLWASQWALRGRFSSIPKDGIRGFRFQPENWLASFRVWLGARQTRWLVLAVWFFFGTTLLSTILSGSFIVSLWGDVPGQDGYSFYNVSSYLILFAVISSHVKTPAQMWRLLGVIVAVGTIIGGYSILQANGHDPLGTSEITGGFITGFAGNTIFTAAVLLMTITVSIGVGAVTLRDPVGIKSKELSAGIRRWAPTIVLAWAWCFVIGIQMLALALTASRGPWLGTLVALSILFFLAAWSGGWRYFGKVSALIGFPAAITLAITLLNISMFDPVLWVSATIAIVIFFSLVALAGWRTLGRITLVGGVAAAIFLAVFTMPTWTGSSGNDPSAPGSSGQFSSVGGQVLGGNLGGRLTHWEVSWDLIRYRPWFSFEELSLPWLRQLIGYGPDLFRPTYLLGSPAEGPNNRPLEPDHAHNFLIHQTVEQGYLGFLSALGLFAASFFLGARWILRRSRELSPVYRLILAVLLATVAGRFIEMMIGVARVSDLTILWVLMGLLAALPSVIQDAKPSESEPKPNRPEPRRTARRRNHRASSNRTPSLSLSGQFVWRLAAVAILLGGVWTLTWTKNVNYVRAAVASRTGVEQFRAGDWESTLVSFDRAIELAPDVTVYYANRAELFLAFLINSERFKEQGCAEQGELDYEVCVAFQSYQSNSDATAQRPLYYRARLAFANSAFNLRLNEEAIKLYEDAVSMVPNSNTMRAALAEAYLEDGQTEKAIEHLDLSLAMGATIEARLLLGIAQMKLGDTEDGAKSLAKGLSSGEEQRLGNQASGLLADYYISLGDGFWDLMTTVEATDILNRVVNHSIGLVRATEIRLLMAEAYTRTNETSLASSNHYYLATLLWEQGFGTRAKDSLEKSLELAPSEESGESARSLLAEIIEAEGN